MIFTEGVCPICRGKLILSTEKQQTTCYGCGGKVSISEVMKIIEEETIVKIMNKEEYCEELNEVLERFPSMLQVADGVASFQKDTYESAFQSYYHKNYKNYLAIDRLYAASEDKEGFLKRLVCQLVETEKMHLAQQEKSEREQRMIHDNVLLSVYMLPAMLHYKGQAMTNLSSAIVERWKEAFPKYQISANPYEKIISGFRKKLCYITTAVCESLGKDDDCYELTILRDYRDNYLRSTKEGEALVDAYYDIAPSIVKRINKSENSSEIYHGIYDKYLKPCIKLLESQKLEECKSLYTDMVFGLEKKFLIQQV